MSQPDDFAPCRLVEHEDGTLSLYFNDFGPTAAFMERHQLQGGGYTWEAVADSLLRLRNPGILKALEFDPEGSMLFVHSRDKEALRAVAALIHQAQADETLLQEAVSHADPELLE